MIDGSALSQQRGGGGAGFTYGPPNNLFGITAGDATVRPLTLTPAATQAAAEATRDAYFTANPTNLASYDAEGNEGLGIVLIFFNAGLSQTIAQTRVASTWQDSGAILALQGEPGVSVDLIGFEDGAILLSQGEVLTASSMIEVSAMIESTKPLQAIGFESTSVMLVGAGESITASVASGDTYRAIGARYTKALGTERPGFVDTGAQRVEILQPIDTGTITGNNIQFAAVNTENAVDTAYSFKSRGATAITGCNVIIRFGSFTDTRQAVNFTRDSGGTTFTIPAESENRDGPDGLFTIVLPLSNALENGVEFRQGSVTFVELIAPTGETIVLASGDVPIPGVGTQNTPYLVAIGNTGPLRGLLHDGDLPATTIEKLISTSTVDRRTTTLTIDASNVVQFRFGMVEFTNDGGVVDLILSDGIFTVGDQLIVKHWSVGGVPGAGVRLEQQGTGGTIDGESDIILDMDSSIVMKYVALNTWRIVASHNEETTAMREIVQDIVGGMVTNNTETGIAVTYDDSGADGQGKLDFVVAETDTNTLPTPSLHALSINIASRVDVTANLNAAQNITFDVSNYAQLTTLSLVVVAGTDQVMTLPVSDGSQTQVVTLAGISTATPGTVTFQLSGTHAGGTVTSNIVTITVANVAAHERVHFGQVLQADTVAEVDFTTDDISQAETTAGSYRVSGIPGTGLHRLYFAVPVAFDSILHINQGGFNITNQFAAAVTRTIDGQQYRIRLMLAASAVNNNYNTTLLTVEV